MELKDQIRIAREAKGLTIADLAEKLGLSRTAIVWWEEGMHRPNSRRMTLVESALEVRFDLSEKGSAMPLNKGQSSISVNPEILSLAVAIGRLPKAHREAIEILVKIGEEKMTRTKNNLIHSSEKDRNIKIQHDPESTIPLVAKELNNVEISRGKGNAARPTIGAAGAKRSSGGKS